MLNLDPWFLENLVCPCDKQPLQRDQTTLVCSEGHRYPIVDGIPVMLLDNVQQTHPYATTSLNIAHNKQSVQYSKCDSGSFIDLFVQKEISATNGIMFQSVVGKLQEYPIPQMRLPYGQGKLLLDIGCNWGRWCVAAGKQGYSPVGLDPSLEAVLAARRVTQQLGVLARFVVGDARYLPFRDHLFDVVFSYSVLQHFAKQNVVATLDEIRRVLSDSGMSLVQMLNSLGLRSLYNQVKRGRKSPERFEVRYWHPAELMSAFSMHIGPSRLMIDGFFSANAQAAEAKILPPHLRAVIYTSELLRKLGRDVPLMTYFADSLYVCSSR